MGDADPGASSGQPDDGENLFTLPRELLLVAAAVYAGCMISPPSLMDDVDAVQAQMRAICWHQGDT